MKLIKSLHRLMLWRQRTAPPKDVLRMIVLFILGIVVTCGIFYHLFGIDLKSYLTPFPLCPFRVITGIPCPGCGMTRAMLSLGQLNLRMALEFNPFSIPLLIVMISYVCNRKLLSSLQQQMPLKTMLLCVFTVWVLRL